MLLPSPESVMGPCTGLPLLLSPSPHSAMCHFQVSSHCCPGFHFVIGCWQITGIPLLLQALICHGPLYRLLMLLPGPESLMGPCTASHCCCLHRHTLPCATFRSPHTLLVCVEFFD
ncbi:unnamed protein product, partial [Staurois parvus]